MFPLERALDATPVDEQIITVSKLAVFNTEQFLTVIRGAREWADQCACGFLNSDETIKQFVSL